MKIYLLLEIFFKFQTRYHLIKVSFLGSSDTSKTSDPLEISTDSINIGVSFVINIEERISLEFCKK